MPGVTILHIATGPAWEAACAAGSYTADSLATEGFIHCSDPGQVTAVANRLFLGRTDLVLMQIDASKLEAPVRYENLEGGVELFPHVYGPLPLGAIVRTIAFTPNADGRFDERAVRDLLAADDAGGAHTSYTGGPSAAADEHAIREASHVIASALGRRDTALLAEMLAPGFVYRGDAGAVDAGAFLDGITNIPGDIAFVRLERLAVDVTADAAFVTGVQHAQVVVNGQRIDDRRGFADFFVRVDGRWLLRAASDLPLTPGGDRRT